MVLAFPRPFEGRSFSCSLMIRLLIVDPLSLDFTENTGLAESSTRLWFERLLANREEVEYTILRGDDPSVCESALKSHGVVLGGSDRSAWEDNAFNDQLLDLIALCKHNNLPLLGICYGAQMLGRALGGKVQPHPKGIELGATRIELTDTGKEHFLFRGLPKGYFHAIETHNDVIMSLPAECRLLASSRHTQAQAFEYRNILFGVQFHPEMSGEDLKDLWDGWKFSGRIKDIPTEYRDVIEKCRCPAIPQVMSNFVDRLRSEAPVYQT